MSTETRAGWTIGPVGTRWRRRTAIATLVSILLLLAMWWLTMTTGALAISPGRVIATLTGGGTRIENLVIIDRRLSRLLAGSLIGFCLGTSGALTQTITRNPIATPDILGVSAGAGTFAVLALVRPETTERLLGVSTTVALVPVAILGGLITTGVILTLGWRGGFDGYRLVLVGLGINALALALTSWLLTRAEVEEASVAVRWLVGSLGGVRMGDVVYLAPMVALAVLVCLRLAGGLGALRLGRDIGQALGVSAGRTEAGALITAVALVSVATAAAGPIAFVAFVAPQVAMRLFGTAGPPPLASGLVGALLLVGADFLAARLPLELPVGIVTSVLGAPVLLYLMTRHLRRTSV
ncbi:iron ABC transporter permease [Aeromicrobium sp. YIM 150415]|uniref:FecCD family ABC transporter permease n=1 Tax=Aeromicrobium sp. YIM 150415 TaxID=2803912 RepID=UPI0019632B40|nr:iron ABC transporter permease [Aeromicrobium sp. YIM 150415]MBM9462981.1 iron ABC transporter permease [Aeromicrobium sp. YIM 150415]